jgi:hypothetical protein
MFEDRIPLFPIWEAGPFRSLITKSNDPKSKPLLVWFDDLKEKPRVFFGPDRIPGQIVNRLPNSLTICLKTTFARLVQQLLFRANINTAVIPATYVLPYDHAQFEKEIQSHPRRYIVKPDGGAMGIGLRLINDWAEYSLKIPKSRHVAQVYLDSRDFGGRKFDLRLYVLIHSTVSDRLANYTTPFHVYVYRRGLARVCAEDYSSDSIYARLTNTSINKQVETNMEAITKLTDDVFRNCNENEIWTKIEQKIGLVIVGALPVLKRGLAQISEVPVDVFQIFGFDVMFDRDWNPFILEVNYRPSLARGTVAEGELKQAMLREALGIVLRDRLQGRIEEPFAESAAAWRRFAALPTARNFHEVRLDTAEFAPLVECMAAVQEGDREHLLQFRSYVERVQGTVAMQIPRRVDPKEATSESARKAAGNVRGRS